MELQGEGGGGAAGVLAREELQRILQMLQETAGKVGWIITPAKPQTIAATEEKSSKTFRH
jgi:hypothetical protein